MLTYSSLILKSWAWKVIKSFHLCQTWWVSWCDPFSCFAIKHQVFEVKYFNIQLPMFTNFITHVYHVALNTSVHQYCHIISIAPPTGHRNSDKHHPIYMTSIVLFFFSISYTTRWHATKKWAQPPTAPPPNARGLQINNQNITDHNSVWGIFHL